MGINDFILKIKRAETPFYAGIKRFVLAALGFQLPIPRFLDPIYGNIVRYRNVRYELSEKFSVMFFRYPVLRSMCASVGERLRMELIPSISGNPKIHIGDDVFLSGKIIITAGRVFPDPELRIGNRTFVGHTSVFSVAKSIEIGDDVLIASGCWISDYSAHPIDPAKRVAGLQVEPDEVRPVRIGNRVWLGSRAIILPGVTVGDDAVIGAAAVVTKDVPPGCICVGNPGRILTRTVYDARTEPVMSTN
jgi:acetyltransferase-like isoleucine patch superfamily enzyme